MALRTSWMRVKSRLSMKHKLILTIVAMVCVVDLSIVLHFTSYTTRAEHESSTAGAREMSLLIAENLSNLELAQRTIERFVSTHPDRIKYIVVVDSTGKKIVGVNESLAIASDSYRSTPEGVLNENADLLQYQIPIAWSTQEQGIIYLGYSTKRLRDQLANVRLISVIFGLFVLAAGIVTALVSSRIALAPIRRVAAVVEEISAGNLSRRIDVRSSDEIGQVAYAFNAMVENLEFAYRELRSSIGDLQKKASDLEREVEHRQRAVDAMQESEHRFRTLSDASFEGIGISEDGRIVDANDQLAHMLGVDRHELIGRELIEFVAPESRDVVLHARMTRMSEVYEHVCIRRDGTLFPVEVRARSMEFGDRIVRVAAMRDITDRKKAEEALRRANDTLERKVTERTAELTATNSALQNEITERTAVASAFRESEERYRSLVNNMKEVVFQTDINGRWTFLNPSWSLITGFQVDETIGKAWRDFVIDEDRAGVDGMQRLLREGTQEFSHQELRYRTADGRFRWLEMFVRATRTSDHALIGTSGTLRDVTDLREVERALRESKEFIDQIVNSVGDPLFVKDRQHRWVIVNESMCNFLGRSRAELLSKSEYDFFSKKEADTLWAKDEEVFLSGMQSISEESFTDASGVTHTTMTKKNLYRDDQGKEFIVGVVRDVSTMKEVEREIRKMNEDLERRVQVRTYELQNANKELIREIGERKRVEVELLKVSRAVEQSPTSVIITDTRGNIEYVNPKFVEVTGYSTEEVLGRNPRILKSGRMPSEDYQSLWKTILAGNEWRGEFQNKKKNGDLFWERAIISGIRNAKGQITNYVAVKEDITEKKAIEAQFRRTQRLEIIGTLAGGIAHDLNNVLAPILMGIQILRMKVSDSKGQQIVSTIEASANRGADIVKQVLTFARGIEGERSAIQMKHLIREVEEIAMETFPRAIKIATQVSKDLWVVNGDGTQLHQVIMNLSVNARDAMPNGGTLTIRAENLMLDDKAASLHLDAKRGPYILLVVSDTGTGIPREVVDKIFDPFFTTKDVGKGTGLGLSTVQTIVRSHNGFVTVYSELGKGSQFKVYLPAGEVRVHSGPETAPVEMPRGNGQCILVVDDESSVREITREILTTYGYDVLLARDGLEGLSLFRQHRAKINAVVTDMMMPQMDGATLIQELRKLDPEVRIVAASGLANNENAAELHNNNVHAFLTKPYKADKLLWVLDTVLK